MTERDIAWLMVRTAGVLFLSSGLSMLPGLLGALPDLIRVAILWDMAEVLSLTEDLKARNPVKSLCFCIDLLTSLTLAECTLLRGKMLEIWLVRLLGAIVRWGKCVCNRSVR